MSNLSNQKLNENELGKVFTFFSTAAATGKTTLAVNFAADLAERGYRVCLIDCDLQFGDVGNCLALESDQNLFKMYEDEEANAVDLVLSTEWKFDVLLAPKELDESYLITKDIVMRAVNHLSINYDYVVVDTTTGFNESNVAILQKTDILFLPCVVDFIPSIKNLKHGLDHLQQLQFDASRIRLILNRDKAETQISRKDVEGLLGRAFQYVVTNDFMGVTKSLKNFEPLVLTNKESKVADDISAILAAELGDEIKKGSGGFFGWLWK